VGDLADNRRIPLFFPRRKEPADEGNLKEAMGILDARPLWSHNQDPYVSEKKKINYIEMSSCPEISDHPGERKFFQALDELLFLRVFQVRGKKILARTLKKKKARLKGGLKKLYRFLSFGKNLIETMGREGRDAKPGMKVATAEIEIGEEGLFSLSGKVKSKGRREKGFPHPPLSRTYGDDPRHSSFVGTGFNSAPISPWQSIL
jgi:hypothetical protein